MTGSLLRSFSLYSHWNRPIVAFPGSIINRVRFYSHDGHSKPRDQENDASHADDDGGEELKRRILKFYNDGDMDEIPSILEEILKRKLAGKNDESLLDQLPSDVRREDLKSGEDSG
ncbi:uncharacterized protein LOC115745691 [Rhodamnia argentea]|uniref:Uncharacterized protein LOC115745691 n=1 Tax=Rhodamnia argentea TaxID=178133 RepID=A0A8B8PQS4_9MYRT|nr:uncharacterized protein LOC115745691 [Rhodamnia argentea]